MTATRLGKSLSLKPLLFCWMAAYMVPYAVAAETPDGGQQGVSDVPVQVAADADSPDVSKSAITEIIVTAQKRSESIRDIPESISVTTGKQLEAQHIDGYADLARTVPDLSFTSLGAPGLSNLEIRGVSSTTGTSTVAIYLDDAPITIRNNSFYSGQSEPILLDIGQSEVLRGPAGTLWGASAMGGTIRFVSNPVSLTQYEGSAGTEISETQHGGLNYVVKGTVNIPIVSDVLGLRLSAETSLDSGYVDHADTSGVIDRQGINNDRHDVVKASMLWDATSALTITPAVFTQRTFINDTGLVDIGSTNYVTSKLVQESGVDTLAVPSLKVNYDLNWADLTSVTSYAYRNFTRVTDGTYFNSAFVGFDLDQILAVPGVDGQLDGDKLAALPGPVDNDLKTGQATEEVRLVSKPYDPNGGSPFAWIAGLYYSDSTNHGDSFQYIPGFNSTFQAVYGVPAANILGVTIPSNDLFYQFDQREEDREFAGFGELSYYMTPALKFTAGFRYLYGRSSYTEVESGFFANVNFVNGTTKAFAATPKLAVTYDVDSTLTTYATAGKGFRLGGINGTVPPSLCGGDLAAFGLDKAPASYQPDKLWNYEAGAKGRFLDNRLSINSAVYDIQWNKIQIDVPLPTCGFDYTANVGQAQSSGVESEIQYRVVHDLTLGAGGQYNHDVFTQDVAGLGVSKGDPVPGAPKWSLNLSADYERPLSDAVTGFVRANWQFTGNSYGTFVQTNADYKRPMYTMGGASIGATFNQWDVSLFIKNILDEKKMIQRPEDNYVPEGYTPVPRIVGLQVNAQF